MHDDLFVIIEELVLGTPRPVLAGFFVILASLILTWIKQGADERERLRRHKVEHAVLPEVCTFPLCGASLEGVGKEERVFGSHSDLPYCSKMCVKRDWKENNHASVVLLLKRRAAALEKERNAHAEASARPWLDQLADVIPNPQAGLSAAGGGVNSWVDTMSMKMEADAASLTARTFSSAYMRRFGPAVHSWARDCHRASGRGCVLVHLSERAIEESMGAPISFVHQRTLQRLDNFKLNKLVREYQAEHQMVLLVMQRGLDKAILTSPFCFSIRETPPAPAGFPSDDKAEAGDKGGKPGGKAGAVKTD